MKNKNKLRVDYESSQKPGRGSRIDAEGHGQTFDLSEYLLNIHMCSGFRGSR